MIETCYGDKAKKVTRYAIKKEKDIFDVSKLKQAFEKLSEGYEEGIEIEIDTREDHRRKGLAYACGAKLICECLKKGLYPSWDAQNKWSVALAEKLGYHFSHEYTAYEVCGY